MLPVSVQPPSVSAISVRRRRAPPTVVAAFIRTIRSTPAGYAIESGRRSHVLPGPERERNRYSRAE